MHSGASGATYTLAAIVDRLGGELLGDGSLVITQVGTLQGSGAGQITFLANPKYRKHLQDTGAAAVIMTPDMAAEAPCAAILTPKPYVYYARVAALLNPVARLAAGLHALASAESPIPASCHLGPGTHVGPSVVLGEGVEIRANAVIGAGASIGAGSIIHPGAVIYPGCQLGEQCIVHSGAVIGADGFGFAPEAGQWLKIPQIGRVVIGNNVEIGANTSIDRGALEDTVIGDGCKLDNQIQIGHNCVIGEHTVIAGCVGIAGSTRIGHHCAIGGAAMILGHLEIAPGTEISPGTMVMKNLTKGGKYTALYPLDTHDKWLQSAAQLKHLGQLAQRVSELEKKLKELETKS